MYFQAITGHFTVGPYGSDLSKVTCSNGLIDYQVGHSDYIKIFKVHSYFTGVYSRLELGRVHLY